MAECPGCGSTSNYGEPDCGIVTYVCDDCGMIFTDVSELVKSEWEEEAEEEEY